MTFNWDFIWIFPIYFPLASFNRISLKLLSSICMNWFFVIISFRSNPTIETIERFCIYLRWILLLTNLESLLQFPAFLKHFQFLGIFSISDIEQVSMLVSHRRSSKKIVISNPPLPSGHEGVFIYSSDLFSTFQKRNSRIVWNSLSYSVDLLWQFQAKLCYQMLDKV